MGGGLRLARCLSFGSGMISAVSPKRPMRRFIFALRLVKGFIPRDQVRARVNTERRARALVKANLRCERKGRTPRARGRQDRRELSSPALGPSLRFLRPARMSPDLRDSRNS